MSVVLADLGGTHLRLSHADNPFDASQYVLADFPSFSSVLSDFSSDIRSLYLASAVTPRAGIIEDTRFAKKSHWKIDLAKLKDDFSLSRLCVFNDLEAAAYGLTRADTTEQMRSIIQASQPQEHFFKPPKLLVGIGTGIGHAFLYEKAQGTYFVQRTHGGHVPALGISTEHLDILAMLQKKTPLDRILIVEDIVSGKGIESLRSLVQNEGETIRLFCEFLGAYCNMLVGGAGAYGGLFLTGGVMDGLCTQNLFDTDAFSRFFIPRLVPVVMESLRSVNVRYCNSPFLALSGLQHCAKQDMIHDNT